MPLVVTQQPNTVVLAGNEIPVSAYDVAIIDVQNTQGSATGFIKLSQTLVSGNKIEFNWNGNTLLVEIVSPGSAGYMNTTYKVVEETGEGLSIWCQALVEEIMKHPELSQNFRLKHNLIGSDYYIYFEPYTWTTDYNLSITVTTSRTYQSGDGLYNPKVYQPNFNFNIQAFKYLSGQYAGRDKYRAKISLPAQIDSTGSEKALINYDLSPLLNANTAGHFTFPEADTFFSKQQPGLIEKISVYLWPSYGEPPTDYEGKYLTDFYLLYGKVSEQKERQFNTNGESFLDELAASKRFLTYAPIEKITDIYAPEKLYFLFRYTGTAKLMCKEYFTDGTTATNTLVTNSVSAYELWEYSAAFMRVRSDSGKTVKKYEIWLQDAVDSIVSDIRTFVLDYNFQQYARYFMFKSRLGVYECFRSTGRGTTSEDVQKSFFERQKQLQATATSKQRELINIESEHSIDINSGYLDEEWNKYFASEVIASEDVYQLKFSQKYAGTIEQATNVVAEDDQDLNSFSFSWILQDVSTEYFNDYDIDPDPPILGDYNYDYNEDYSTG